jgi:hypothetical protein
MYLLTVNELNPLLRPQVYSDTASYQVVKYIFTVDSANTAELKNRFKNWGAVAFVDFSKVLISETENQIVIVYVTEQIIGKWYVRIVASFKDNKVKIEAFDDGNVYIAPTYISGYPSGGLASRSTYVSVYFDKYGGSIPYKKKMDQARYKGVVDWHNGIILMVQGIENALQQKSKSTEEEW